MTCAPFGPFLPISAATRSQMSLSPAMIAFCIVSSPSGLLIA